MRNAGTEANAGRQSAGMQSAGMQSASMQGSPKTIIAIAS